MKKFLFLIVALITLIVSVGVSLIYFNLALDLIPPAAMSDFNREAGRVGFILGGVGIGLGLVILEALLFWLLPLALRNQKTPPA